MRRAFGGGGNSVNPSGDEVLGCHGYSEGDGNFMPEESDNKENFVNNASLGSAQEDETKHVIVSESETIQPIANQNPLQLQGNKYAPSSKSKISDLPQGVDMRSTSSPQRGGEFADGRSKTSPDSEQIEYTVAKQYVRNSESVEQIQDRARVQVRGEINSHSEEQHLQSDTNISRHTERQRKYPVTKTKELSCKKDNYIEITNQLDCFGSKEPHNDDTNFVILSDSERSQNRGDFTNNAILRGLNNCSPQNDGKNSCRLMRGEVNNENRKVAFTLAEVLITLGIIGVVAAMTLPAVIANYQKHVTVTKLEKAYTTLNQAFKLSEANNEPSEHWDNAFEMGADNYFNKYWKPYLNGVEICKKYQDCGYNSNTPFYTLKGQVDSVTVGDSSHSRILFRINSDTIYLLFTSWGNPSGTGSRSANYIWIDINGGKGPNMFGKDVFQFKYEAGSGVVPFGIDKPSYVKSSCAINSGKGDCCAAKIVQDGWKIADDYPW